MNIEENNKIRVVESKVEGAKSTELLINDKAILGCSVTFDMLLEEEAIDTISGSRN